MATLVKPIVIESFGLPGAGKSTICQQVTAILHQEGWHVLQRHDYYRWLQRCPWTVKVKVHTYGYLKRFPITLKILSYVLMRPPLNRWSQRLARTLALHHAYLEEFLHSTSPRLCLLDQWTLQSLWSIGVTHQETDGAPMTTMAHMLITDAPHAYIYFHLPPEVAAHRVAHRPTGQSRFDDLPYHDIEKILKQYESLLQAIRIAIEEQKCLLLCLDATKPVPDQVDQVISWIKSIINK
jgi:thymidylate kinase